MKVRAVPSRLLLAATLLSGCGLAPARKETAPATLLGEGALLPSPRLIVGRIVAIDPAQKFAFIELATDVPQAALASGTELISRTLDLRETARLRASPYQRGRMLGTKVVAGQPSPGDEVVWLAP